LKILTDYKQTDHKATNFGFCGMI